MNILCIRCFSCRLHVPASHIRHCTSLQSFVQRRYKSVFTLNTGTGEILIKVAYWYKHRFFGAMQRIKAFEIFQAFDTSISRMTDDFNDFCCQIFCTPFDLFNHNQVIFNWGIGKGKTKRRNAFHFDSKSLGHWSGEYGASRRSQASLSSLAN